MYKLLPLQLGVAIGAGSRSHYSYMQGNGNENYKIKIFEGLSVASACIFVNQIWNQWLGVYITVGSIQVYQYSQVPSNHSICSPKSTPI